MNFESRQEMSEIAEQTVFDAVIVGGGINGAAIFHTLSSKGYRVLLLEKGDFSSGTSQSSAMMIWGSLQDLTRLRFLKVAKLCTARERLIKQKKHLILNNKYLYLPTKENGRRPMSAFAALYAYWILGGGRRSFPQYKRDISDIPMLKKEEFSFLFEYEEARIASSDARFVLDWLLPFANSTEHIALNYCSLSDGRFERDSNLWNLEIKDTILDKESVIKAKWVINATGVWTDTVNKMFGVETPYKHAFGKGVFIGLERDPQHQSHLIIETKEAEGCMGFLPWKHISLWGPNDTGINSLEKAFEVNPSDVQFLLQELNRHLAKPVSVEDIVSLRCGVRPLAVKRSYSKINQTVEISRKYVICRDKQIPWISIYGGKLTSCILVAKSVAKILGKNVKPLKDPNFSMSLNLNPESCEFPNLSTKFPTARWCAEKEMCWTLEDYLRRRTNISQWIRRGGLGAYNENAEFLTELARTFCDKDEDKAVSLVQNYKQKIETQFDEVLKYV